MFTFPVASSQGASNSSCSAFPNQLPLQTLEAAACASHYDSTHRLTLQDCPSLISTAWAASSALAGWPGQASLFLGMMCVSHFSFPACLLSRYSPRFYLTSASCPCPVLSAYTGHSPAISCPLSLWSFGFLAQQVWVASGPSLAFFFFPTLLRTCFPRVFD